MKKTHWWCLRSNGRFRISQFDEIGCDLEMSNVFRCLKVLMKLSGLTSTGIKKKFWISFQVYLFLSPIINWFPSSLYL